LIECSLAIPKTRVSENRGLDSLRMTALKESIDRLAAEKNFSGVVRVDRGDDVEFAKAYGLAHRGYEFANAIDTQFAIASGTKGLTALTVMSLIEDGTLDMTTTARSLLGDDLPMVDERVTVEHLLGHRSGIGDYLDEEVERPVNDYVMTVPVNELTTTEQYVRVLDGYPSKFAPNERFSYSNSGYVLLALIAERSSGSPFHRLVKQRVCEPAGMSDTEFMRSDELTGRAAVGYLATEGSRTNIFHLPVMGSGDGGIYSTAADISCMWKAMFGGLIVSMDRVAEMVHPRSDARAQSMRYGLGFWLNPKSEAVVLEGSDAGVSFRTVHYPTERITHTVMSNFSDGAWPIARHLDQNVNPKEDADGWRPETPIHAKTEASQDQGGG
jgi:CubicO group peptidase (beta-lactamase class C family)